MICVKETTENCYRRTGKQKSREWWRLAAVKTSERKTCLRPTISRLAYWMFQNIFYRTLAACQIMVTVS